MKTHATQLALALMLAAVAFATIAAADDPRLSLRVAGGNQPVEAGDLVTITIRMTDLGEHQAVGFQAFLEFDPQRLTFLGGSYTPTPFGLPIITPIEAVDGQIDVASGIDPAAGQQPTSSDATLVLLNFLVEEDMQCVSTVIFRDHFPATSIAGIEGNVIEPVDLVSLPAEPPDPDLTGDGMVGVGDLLELILNWGPCEDPSLCPADLNCDGMVGVGDLLVLISEWG